MKEALRAIGFGIKKFRLKIKKCQLLLHVGNAP